MAAAFEADRAAAADGATRAMGPSPNAGRPVAPLGDRPLR
jgi:hypothetical protein